MNLDIVIVTYNRLEKLKHTLECYENQTKAFRNLIIIDNCSTDGTKEFLEEYCSKKHDVFSTVLITAEENLGGSGGFYLGEKKAMELNADWVMVADDDAYAYPNMVENFYDFTSKHDTENISALCAAVHNMDGTICTHHRSNLVLDKKDGSLFFQDKKLIDSDINDYNKDFFPISIITYVGSFLNVKALKKIGIVNPKYFIYYDDCEHSIRLSKYGDILVVPSINITHDNEKGIATYTNALVTWREYYIKRNEAHMLLKHLPRTIIKDYLFLFRCIIGTWLHKKETNIFEKIDREAKIDALFGKLGKHKLYKPGWQI